MKIDYISTITLLVFTIILFSFSSYAQNQVKWYSFSSGFGTSNLGDSTIISSAGESFIGISSNENSKIISGFLSYNPSIVTDVNNQQENIPTIFKLTQNYPNPFNPTTTIKYSIPIVEMKHVSSVQLKVYDILGKEVATLVNETKAPGNYSITFNAKNFASGVYFYRLKAGNYIAVKKMILLR